MVAPWTVSEILRTASKSPRRSDGEAGFDDVDAEIDQGLGDLELFAEVHAAAGGLLAVAERGVEDDDASGHGSGVGGVGDWGLGTDGQ